MFTQVTLQNFKCFDHIVFDLRDKRKNPKNLILLYGENGAGKSNLISAFVLLKEVLNTLNVRDFYSQLLNQIATEDSQTTDTTLRQQLLKGMRDIPTIIDDYKMIGNDEPITAEYEFSINGKIGNYKLQLDRDEIIYERLEFLLNKRRGVYFECKDGAINLNNSIILDKDLASDIKHSAKRFWGKHSIFAIILHEINEKSRSFAWENLSLNFRHVLNELGKLSCELGIGNRLFSALNAPSSLEILEKAASGSISADDEPKLDLFEQLFSDLFSIVTPNCGRAYYERVYGENRIDYQLYVQKMVAGKIRSIPFSKESTGTNMLLKVFCYLICAYVGGTVILDEIDSEIHDFLFKDIITSIKPVLEKTNGQLIITTHNTALLETDFARDSAYIVEQDNIGHRSAYCVNSVSGRTYQQNNVRSKYLENAYGGLPNMKSNHNMIDTFRTFVQTMSKLDPPEFID